MSKRFWLDGTDWAKIGKGALIALGGTLVTYLTTVIVPTLDQDTMIGASIAALSGIVLNAIRKYLADNSQ